MLTFQQGDLLLYAGGNVWYERIITTTTHGPYVHVECAISATESIGAVGRGIVRHTAPAPAVVIPTGVTLAQHFITDGLNWLEQQVGDRYGWLDILADSVKAVLPATPTPFLIAPRAYDCSHLAAVFLAVGGYPKLPAQWYTLAPTVSPNDLARFFHVIK